jgi:predicted phosphodiesterase
MLMRIAIFSDVHGNLGGLEAVLADIERRAVDLSIFAGDLCPMGPRPAECLRLVRERRIPTVRGNADEWLLNRGDSPERMRRALAWTADQLAEDERDWLGRLPFGLRVSPTALAADDLLIVHANPHNVNDILYPPEEAQLARFGEVRQSDAQLKAMLDGTEAAVIAFGHLHIPNIRPLEATTLVNVASVSLPGDEDYRAKYALLSWDGDHWTAAHHYVSYDVAAENGAFRANQPPGWEQAVAELEEKGYYYPQRI